MTGFIFGGNTPWSYDELQKKRTIAEELVRANMSTPRNVGEGLNAIGRALAFRSIDKKASKRDAELKGEFQSQWDSAFGGFGSGASGGGSFGPPSGTWTPDAPGPKPTDMPFHDPNVELNFPGGTGGRAANSGVYGSYGQEFDGRFDFGSAVMTPQEMLIAGAEARGLDPIDVATAISYETGGKFDPMISGPTTQWGTHRGLIQFGEPQAAQHGVDFSSPDAAWRSQLDPNNGAVWDYLKGAGVQPGMGLPEVYSAINAGSVGRMGASDANNGGAPGTVADKVAGMGPHREKAAAFLGGTWTPDPNAGSVTASAQNAPSGGFGGGGMDLQTIAELAGSPYATPGQKAVLAALMQQQMDAMDPMRAIEMQKAQLELAQAQNPAAPKPIEVNGVLLDPITFEPIYDGRTPPAPDKPPTSVQEYEFYKQGAIARGETPMAYEDFLVADEKASVPPGAPNIGTIPPGYEAVQDPNTGAWSMRPVPGGPAAVEADAAAAATERREAAKIAEAEVITTAAQRAREAAAKRDFGAGGTTFVAGLPIIGGETESGEVVRQVNAIKANGSFAALQQMRANSPTGGALGGVSDKDLELLANKAGALDPNSPNLARDIDDYERALLRTLYGPELGDQFFEESRQPSAGSPPPVAAPSDDGWTTLPNGVKVRVKQ